MNLEGVRLTISTPTKRSLLHCMNTFSLVAALVAILRQCAKLVGRRELREGLLHPPGEGVESLWRQKACQHRPTANRQRSNGKIGERNKRITWVGTVRTPLEVSTHSLFNSLLR